MQHADINNLYSFVFMCLEVHSYLYCRTLLEQHIFLEIRYRCKGYCYREVRDGACNI